MESKKYTFAVFSTNITSALTVDARVDGDHEL
jgi:hypothetical protein